MSFEGNANSSVSNLTCEPQRTGTHESSTDADDINLQIMPTAEKCAHELNNKKWKRGVSPRQYYGRSLPSMTEKAKHTPSRPDRKNPGSSVAKLTATATVTVELQHQDVAHVNPPSTKETDLTVVDCEEEFV